MASKPKGVPEGYHTATPYMIIKDAARALTFYEKAFGATVLSRVADPSGKVRHAEIRIGDSILMITDENPEYPEWQSPESRGGSPVHIYLYVEDVDGLFRQAIAAGATQLLPVQDQFYGDRSGGVTDPFGHVWYIATRKEDVSPEELERRTKAQAARA